MTNSTVHFVYKSPRHGDFLGRMLDKISFDFPLFPPLWRNGNHIPWQIPKRHPASASYNLIKAFKKVGDLKFYDLWEKRACKINPGDKFIGLPIHVYDGRNWDDPSIRRVTTLTLEKYPELDATIIMPYCHDERYNTSVRGIIERYGKNLVILSGKIWTDTWEQSPIRSYVKNLLRVNMGIDADEYPVVKKTFNLKGKRKYLYIGQTAWYKNTIQLEKIAEQTKNFQGGYISSGTIRGWKKIADWADLTPEFMSRLAEEYDIFLNTSTADPSPATILEQMCFGFAVACTPESSYQYDSITRLDTSDTAFNCSQLNKLQQMNEDELIERAKINRVTAIEYHNWDEISSRIVNFVCNKPKDADSLFLVD